MMLMRNAATTIATKWVTLMSAAIAMMKKMATARNCAADANATVGGCVRPAGEDGTIWEQRRNERNLQQTMKIFGWKLAVIQW